MVQIICIDDEPLVIWSYQEFFREFFMSDWGWKLLGIDSASLATALDAKSALDAMKAARFDLVITDQRLPDGFGDNLVRAIREGATASAGGTRASVPIVLKSVGPAPEGDYDIFLGGHIELRCDVKVAAIALLRHPEARSIVGRFFTTWLASSASDGWRTTTTKPRSKEQAEVQTLHERHRGLCEFEPYREALRMMAALSARDPGGFLQVRDVTDAEVVHYAVEAVALSILNGKWQVAGAYGAELLEATATIVRHLYGPRS